MRPYLIGDRLATERARFQPLFAAENRKPTIAQWSVFLPRLGRARRQASPPILSLPGSPWTPSLRLLLLAYQLCDTGTIAYALGGLEGARFAQAAEALRAHHQMIKDFHSE